jgi:molybdopterin synthase sulfur carrier subunit
MATVWIPPLLQDVTDGKNRLLVRGDTVSDLIVEMDKTYPGIALRLCQEGSIRPGIAVVVDSMVSNRGLRHPVSESSEVHFLPAISGG